MGRWSTRDGKGVDPAEFLKLVGDLEHVLFSLHIGSMYAIYGLYGNVMCDV